MCFEFGRFVGFFSRWGWKGRKREDSRQKMGVRERGTVSGQFLTSSFLKGPRTRSSPSSRHAPLARERRAAARGAGRSSSSSEQQLQQQQEEHDGDEHQRRR